MIDRQLDLFERDNRRRSRRRASGWRRYNRADRDEAEELYGDYVDAVETRSRRSSRTSATTYARTLEEGVDEQYEREFNRAVAKRMPAFALEIENR